MYKTSGTTHRSTFFKTDGIPTWLRIRIRRFFLSGSSLFIYILHIYFIQNTTMVGISSENCDWGKKYKKKMENIE